MAHGRRASMARNLLHGCRMPLFDVFCDLHGEQEILTRDSDSLSCPVCDRRVERRFSSPPSFKVDFTYGFDMGAGRYFDTKRQRDDWMREGKIRKR
jgi:hypothetical protein